MVVRNKHGSLKPFEKQLVKALLEQGWRNQDIQDLINRGRIATINSARITEVKKNKKITPADSDSLNAYISRKKSWDPRTGLNVIENERLIRAREAIALAVQVFNSPTLNFKTELFAILANIAWTYLMHEYFESKGISIEDKSGKTHSLSYMLEHKSCPVSKGIKKNLVAIKTIRDTVEHRTLGRSDHKWLSLFQACCLNFNKVICDLFGEKLSLKSELGFAIQFAKLDLEQISNPHDYDVPEHIAALDARLNRDIDPEELQDLEYQFRVIYTLDAASKSNSHFQFISPESAEGKEIKNVVATLKAADDLYPHKPSQVVSLVNEQVKVDFKIHNHTQAWKLLKIRPSGVPKSGEVNRKYCIYHPTHKDYTYSDEWVKLLIKKLSKPKEAKKIFSFKLR